MRSLALLLLVAWAGAVDATNCPCKDQTGKGFGFLECEPQQSGFCMVDKGVITSWCKTPPADTRNSAENLKRWITSEFKTTKSEPGALLLLESGVYVSGGATAAVPRTLPAVRELDVQASSMRIRFAADDPAGIEQYEKWRGSALIEPASKANLCGQNCQRNDCSKIAPGVDRDACLQRCNLRCGK